MTDRYRPLIRSQAELLDAWRRLIRPLGFHRRSLWLLMIDRDSRPIPAMTEITDLPDAPDEDTTGGVGHLLGHLVPEGDAGRWALLLSRPGAHSTDESDRLWVGALYDTLRQHGVPHDVIHLATDVEIRPVPLDEVTGYVRAS
jgi:hypothetical protein